MNLVDDDIKWMTEGEIVMDAPLDGSAMIGEEETSIRVERALTLLDTWTVVEPDGSISMNVSGKDTHTPTSISIAAVTISRNTREESYKH